MFYSDIVKLAENFGIYLPESVDVYDCLNIRLAFKELLLHMDEFSFIREDIELAVIELTNIVNSKLGKV